MNTHLINSRAYTSIKPITEELALNPQKNYLFDLPYLGVLSLEGEKSVDFLQGQLTADIQKANDIQMIQAAQCNLKGRILALLDVVNWNGIKLVLPEDILEQTQNSLSKTALLSRVSIKEEKQYKLFGFYLQNPQDLIPYSLYLPKETYAKAESSSFCYYHLGQGFYIFLIDNNQNPELSSIFAERKQLLGSLTWHSLRLKQHELSIYPESRGLFLPHRLDLQQTSYLSFDKGCYKGQEIIARTHYRATLKHQLLTYIITTEEKLFSGQKLYKSDEAVEVGELVDFSILGNNQYLIAVSIVKNAPQEFRFEHSAQIIQLKSV
ncbi:folate-binding protein YgfZ [Legionella sp. km772]|nr:folate-binding protein YgfZ [Legionella sp. km772]RUR13194.1 folate-binding protein YgfZ [Legionella sp. km772]